MPEEFGNKLGIGQGIQLLYHTFYMFNYSDPGMNYRIIKRLKFTKATESQIKVKSVVFKCNEGKAIIINVTKDKYWIFKQRPTYKN